MLLSVHLAESTPRETVRTLRGQAALDRTPGLRWGQIAATIPLAAGFVPPPRPDGTALVAAWESEEALDRFLDEDALADRWAGGWSSRLTPLRAYGEIAALPELGKPPRETDDDEPVMVLTLGSVHLHRALPFLRASQPAEQQAVDDPALLLGTALARPPRFVGTCSLWRTAREMRAYASGAGNPSHAAASKAQRQRSFHRESVFARFRPYAAGGTWRGAAVP